MGYNNVMFSKKTQFLVTGAAGFIGSNLVEALLKLGFKVRGLDNFSTGKKENVQEFINHPQYEFIEGDIRDYKTCSIVCTNVDYVLHQAALGSVPRSMSYPLIYEDNNITGTSNILEAARQMGVKRVVYASSSSVYGDSDKLPKVEGEEGNILSPYALTKKINEYYGKLYTEVYGLECIGLRYFNVFGRRQDPNSQYAAVIPKFIKALRTGQKVEIYGDGEQSRDFTYIENVIEANLKACFASKQACGQAYNIAFGERFTINEIYNLMCEEMCIEEHKPRYVEPRPGDIRDSLAQILKAQQLLGYKPDWNFTKGFLETIKWYKKV